MFVWLLQPFPSVRNQSFLYTNVDVCVGEGGGAKEGISLNTVEVTEALAKENIKQKKRGSEWSSTRDG